MASMLMSNDFQKFGKNDIHLNTTGNRKSIKDLINKFDNSDDKKQEKRCQRIDFISNLNNLKLNSNTTESSRRENSRPVSLNFESIKIPATSNQVNKFREQQKSFSNSVQFASTAPQSTQIKEEQQSNRYRQIISEKSKGVDKELQLEISKTRLTEKKIEQSLSGTLQDAAHPYNW